MRKYRTFVAAASPHSGGPSPLSVEPSSGALSKPPSGYGCRLAVFDSLVSPPRIEDIFEPTKCAFIEKAAAKAHEEAQRLGGKIPYAVVREIIENLLHAGLKDPVVVIAEQGNMVRVADRGQGISDKEKALEPGFTTATAAMRALIRGVGSGLPIANETMRMIGGKLEIDDNLAGGTVVTLRYRAPAEEGAAPPPSTTDLNQRHRRILLLMYEAGQLGPSHVSRELNLSTTTAFRELDLLCHYGLATTVKGGKRSLTPLGRQMAESLFERQEEP